MFIGLALVGPVTETPEQRRLNKKISQELSDMRSRVKAGKAWDPTRRRRTARPLF
jgi:hypothetical protein